MRHNNQNPFDILVENLILEFSKIKDFNLLSEDEKGREMFNFVTYRLSEIASLKALYYQAFLPAVNKKMAESVNQMNSSKYKSLLKIDRDQIKETYYDTIRMGYVQLFHKLENFYRDLLKVANNLFSQDSNISIEAYYKEKYNVDIQKNWKNKYPVEKINWICNRVKHSDGFPKDNYPIGVLEHLHPKDQRLRFEKDELIKDIDDIQKFYITLMQRVFALGSIKMIMCDFNADDEFINDDLRCKINDMKTNANNFLEFYRN
ncbi:MAG: hypothetical protein WC679_04100 [Bacteroidales bacterium]|jgi:hypothetical protein